MGDNIISTKLVRLPGDGAEKSSAGRTLIKADIKIRKIRRSGAQTTQAPWAPEHPKQTLNEELYREAGGPLLELQAQLILGTF
jgi:hypothetical protein